MTHVKRAAAAVLAAGLVFAGTGAAEANSESARTTFPNGVPLTANAYVSSMANSDSCGDYTSSAIIGAAPNLIKNTTSFHANGVGASVGGGSASGNGTDFTVSWRNDDGARGADLSGTVCINWATWYLSMSTTASSFSYGVARTATASS